jgi:hypothetical protein
LAIQIQIRKRDDHSGMASEEHDPFAKDENMGKLGKTFDGLLTWQIFDGLALGSDFPETF